MRASSREHLQKLVRKLESDPYFSKRYLSRVFFTYGKRRALIADYLYMNFRENTAVEDRDQLRRYFDAKLKHPQTEENKYGHIPSVLLGDTDHEYAQQLWEVAIALENDARFDSDYKNAHNKHGGDRRTLIALAARRLNLTTPHGAFYEQLRRYFDDTMGVPELLPNLDTASYAKDATIEFWLDHVRDPPAQPPDKQTPLCSGRWSAEEIEKIAGELVEFKFNNAPAHVRAVQRAAYAHAFPTHPQETTVTTKPITVETKTFVNGADITTYADSAVYELIAAEEAKIKELEKIEAKPKRLVAEIEKRRAGIAALVAHLDSKDAA